ncbi:MAG: cupredoxin domain-containing protein [Pseudomonadota bacterium]
MNRATLTPVLVAAVLFTAAPLSSPTAYAAEPVRTVSITMGDYAYMPETIRVHAGETITLNFTNNDSITPHNFILKHKDYGLDVELDVAAGEDESVTITPTTPGRYSYYCDKQLLFFKSHRERGMEGTLLVAPAEAPQ